MRRLPVSRVSCHLLPTVLRPLYFSQQYISSSSSYLFASSSFRSLDTNLVRKERTDAWNGVSSISTERGDGVALRQGGHLYRGDTMGVRSGEARQWAVKELQRKVFEGLDCWAYDIHNLAFIVKNSRLASSVEATVLMQACARDILDLGPRDQGTLTEIVWDIVSEGSVSTERRDPLLYAHMLKAFTFQDREVDVEAMLEEMERKRMALNRATVAAIIDHLCHRGKVEEALARRERTPSLQMSELLASSLIFGHASLGDINRAEEVLKELNARNIYWGRNCYEAFVLGSAKAGDIDSVDFFLHKLKVPTDSLVMAAVHEMNKEHPEHLELLLDLEPRDVLTYCDSCRRTVKALLEAGNMEAAWRIVLKTRSHAENNREKARVVKISPSVIVVTHLLQSCDSVELVLERLTELSKVDSWIEVRTVPLVIDLCFKNSFKVPFGKSLISSIMSRCQSQRQVIYQQVAQVSKRLMKEALASESEEKIYNIFRVFSQLGLKLEGDGKSGARRRSWDLMMEGLIPMIPPQGSWTVASLKSRCWEVNKVLAKHNKSHGGMYSHSVLWGNIIQYLLNREEALFFRTAAALVKELGIAYSPQRWVLSLSNCLLKFEDVDSYLDIVEMTYHNSAKKGDTVDYEAVCGSLLQFVRRGERQGVRAEDSSELRVLQVLRHITRQITDRGLPLPEAVRERLVTEVRRHGDSLLLRHISHLKVIDQAKYKASSYKVKR